MLTSFTKKLKADRVGATQRVAPTAERGKLRAK